MADQEPREDVTASTSEPVSWPDPSRPIVNEQPWGGYPQQRPGYQQWADPFDGPGGPRRRLLVIVSLVIIALALASVWLLWWR